LLPRPRHGGARRALGHVPAPARAAALGARRAGGADDLLRRGPRAADGLRVQGLPPPEIPARRARRPGAPERRARVERRDGVRAALALPARARPRGRGALGLDGQLWRPRRVDAPAERRRLAAARRPEDAGPRDAGVVRRLRRRRRLRGRRDDDARAGIARRVQPLARRREPGLGSSRSPRRASSTTSACAPTPSSSRRRPSRSPSPRTRAT